MNVAGMPAESVARRLAQMCGLYRAWDLPLVLWPLLWSSLLAAGGKPDLSRIVGLLVAMLFVRSAAWLLYEPEADGLRQLPRERFPLGGLLILGGLCFAVPLGWAAIWIPAAGAFIATWFSLRRRSFLAEPVLALGLTLVPLAAWHTQGGAPVKGMGLLLMTAFLWLVSAMLAVRQGKSSPDATLASIAAPHGALVVLVLKLAALIAFGLMGREFKLGVFHLIGLGVAIVLTFHQSLLARRGLEERAAAMELWWGAAIFCGIAFHYICALHPSAPPA